MIIPGLLKRLVHLVILLWCLSFEAIAEPIDTHRALFEIFSPQEVWQAKGEQLTQDSWPQVRELVPENVWEHLEPLHKLPLTQREAAFLKLSENPTTAPLHLGLRRFYLQWLYAGDKGYQWAGLKLDQDEQHAAPKKPKLLNDQLQRRAGSIVASESTIDYLIVGSGPAGSVLAYELSRAGFKTVLVDRGSFVMPDTIDTREAPELKIGGGAVPAQLSSILVRNGSTIGGGSTVNVDLAFAPTLKFVSDKIESWRKSGFIEKDQWTTQKVSRAYRWVEEKIQTRELETTEINANNMILWKGAKACGLEPQLYDLNALAHSDNRSNKRSAVNSLLLEAMARTENPLIVIPDLKAKEVVTRYGQVIGVTFNKEKAWDHPAVWNQPNQLNLQTNHQYWMQARHVILCAGAQGTAELLLRSKLGGPKVGQGVVLHPSLPLIGLFDRKIAALEGTPSSVYVQDNEDEEGLLYECMSGTPEYVAMMLFGSGQEIGDRLRNYNQLGGFGFLLVDSVEMDNRIVLDASQQVQVQYRIPEQDKVRLRRGAQKAVRMMLAAGAKEVYLPSSEIHLTGTHRAHLQAFKSIEDTQQIEQLNFEPARTILTSAHMQSTCKMGTVIDSRHRVKGVANLYVCDSSIFPTSVGANPMQTIYTIAKLFSEDLIAQRRI